MKALFRIALSSLALCGVTMEAQIRPDPGHVELSVAFLYLRPLYDNTYYVIDHSANPTPEVGGNREDNGLNWHPAFRLEGLYTFCNDPGKTLEATWIHFHSDDSVSTSGRLQSTYSSVPVQFTNFIGIASSSIDIDYDAFDILYGQALFDSCPFALILQVGLQYVNMDVRETIGYTDTAIPNSLSLINHSTFWGIGPEIGFDASYGVLMLFGWNAPAYLHASLKGALLVVSSQSTFEQEQLGSPFFRTDSDRQWRFAPTWDARLGFAYDFCFRCLDVGVEIGYEVIGNRNAIQVTTFENNVRNFGHSNDQYRSLDFHGPYVALGLSF